MMAENPQLRCVHCDLPFPPAERVTETVDDDVLNFCCHGCRGAYLIIRGAGLESFYRRREHKAGIIREAFTRQFDADYLQRYVTHAGDKSEISLIIEGIHCAACVWLIERLLDEHPGIITARVNFATHRLLVGFDPTRTTPSAICTRLAEIGYLPRPYTPDELQRAAERERRSLLLRFGTAAFLSMQLMGFSIALYGGYLRGIDPDTRQLLQILAALVATPVVFYGGFPFLRGAWFSLRNRSANMDLLITLGTVSAYSYSLYALSRGGEVYFDTAAMIVTLILAGRLYESGARRQASSGIDRLLQLAPSRARRITGEGVTEVDSHQLLIADHILVSAGERFPVDGQILTGCTEVDEAAVNGEPLPVVREPGMKIVAGTLNLSGSVEVLVTAVANESFVARVARLVEQAQACKAPLQRLADRVAMIFIPLVLLVAVGTWLYWFDQPGGWLHAITVLVVACPCALGLATPMAAMVATGNAAEHGILFRGGDILEGCAQVDLVAFDKTGTLTDGRPLVTHLSPHECSAERLLELAARAAAGSSHPLARGITKAAVERGVSTLPAAHLQTIPGRGTALHTDEGLLLTGSWRYLHEQGITAARTENDRSEVHVALNGKYVGCISLADQLRNETATAVAALKKMGLGTLLLTGDQTGVAAHIATILRLDKYHAELTPADKAALIKDAERSGQHTLMVGDGINDAPALVSAHVGCAISGGTDIAIESADLVLARADLTNLPFALRLARQTVRIIRQNLIWAFSYNLVAIPLAASGKLAPVYGAAAMALSSVCVVANSLRLKRIRKD